MLLLLCYSIALCEVLRMYINGFAQYKYHFHWLIEIKCKLLLVYMFLFQFLSIGPLTFLQCDSPLNQLNSH